VAIFLHAERVEYGGVEGERALDISDSKVDVVDRLDRHRVAPLRVGRGRSVSVALVLRHSSGAGE
jgi:hypothetical protein